MATALTPLDVTRWPNDRPSWRLRTEGTKLAASIAAISAALFGGGVTSASTDGGSSVEPLLYNMTMTGIGGVGGRAKFKMSTEVALGSWANALKAEVDWGAAGAVTGLGSALVAEMTLGPGSQAGGTYGVLELELNAPADSGDTNVAFIYASMQGADDDALDDAVSLISLNGVTAGAASIFNTFSQITNAAVQASLKIKINGTEWFIPLMDTQVGT